MKSIVAHKVQSSLIDEETRQSRYLGMFENNEHGIIARTAHPNIPQAAIRIKQV